MKYVYHIDVAHGDLRSAVRLSDLFALAANAKMMFDGAELFKGLTAWFSSSVPECVKSLWGKV